MNKVIIQDGHKKERLSIFDFSTEVIGWIQIVFSLLSIGCLLGLIIYILKQDKLGLGIAITFAIPGLVTGIIVATNAWKNNGTIDPYIPKV